MFIPREREGALGLVGLLDGIPEGVVRAFLDDVRAAREETRPVEIRA